MTLYEKGFALVMYSNKANKESFYSSPPDDDEKEDKSKNIEM